jgi:hypothetical protein
MTPAFSSTRQAAVFAVLLLVLLALPEAIAKTGWLQRNDIYPALPMRAGPFPWIQQQIFSETSDVDVVFLGSSHIWNAISAPLVQKKFSADLGREAHVLALCWPSPGFDTDFVVARDLLDHRHVRMLVVYDEGASEQPHRYSPRWFVIGQNSKALAGLSLLGQARLYCGAILGMPRHLLSLVRPDLTEDPAHGRPNWWNSYYRAPNIAQQLGSLNARLGYGITPDFSEFQPHGQATPHDVLVYSPQTKDGFTFTDARFPVYQLHFAQKLAQLCQEHGTRLVFLHTPSLNERDQKVISEREFWPVKLGAPVDIVGIPGAKLLAGISDADQLKLFYMDDHLNQNGQEMFTALITPALEKLYASPINPR